MARAPARKAGTYMYESAPVKLFYNVIRFVVILIGIVPWLPRRK